MKSMFERIPNELLLHIFRYLDILDLFNCSLVSESLRNATDQLCLWMPAYRRELGRWEYFDDFTMRQLDSSQIERLLMDISMQSNTTLAAHCIACLKQIISHHCRSRQYKQRDKPGFQIPIGTDRPQHPCMILGPGLDDDTLMMNFFPTIFKWLDLADFQRYSQIQNPFPVIGLSGSTLAFIIPGIAHRIHLATIHALVQRDRSSLYVVNSRLNGPNVIIESTSFGEPDWIITKGLRDMLTYTKSVIYVLHSELLTSQLGPDHEVLYWNKARKEFNAIAREMSSSQIILILVYGPINEHGLPIIREKLAISEEINGEAIALPIVNCAGRCLMWLMDSESPDLQSKLFDLFTQLTITPIFLT